MSAAPGDLHRDGDEARDDRHDRLAAHAFGGLTGRALAAHIHLGKRGKAGPVALALCGPCRSGMRKSATLPASLLNALEAGRAYVNVHTARNPDGEIRGQIAAVALRITP